MVCGLRSLTHRVRVEDRIQGGGTPPVLVGLFLLLIIMQGLADLLFPRTCADPEYLLNKK